MALPLLPADRIRDAFIMMKNAQTPPYVDDLAELFSYIEEIWLNTVTPDAFSVYGDDRAIANCSISSSQSVENTMLGISPFCPWKFIGKSIFRQQSRTHAPPCAQPILIVAAGYTPHNLNNLTLFYRSH